MRRGLGVTAALAIGVASLAATELPAPVLLRGPTLAPDKAKSSFKQNRRKELATSRKRRNRQCRG